MARLRVAIISLMAFRRSGVRFPSAPPVEINRLNLLFRVTGRFLVHLVVAESVRRPKAIRAVHRPRCGAGRLSPPVKRAKPRPEHRQRRGTARTWPAAPSHPVSWLARRARQPVVDALHGGSLRRVQKDRPLLPGRIQRPGHHRIDIVGFADCK